MPKLEIEDAAMFEVEEGKRLALATEEEASIDILHDVNVHLQEQ